MGEDNSSKMSLVTAIIGAVGAIGAAMLPIYLNRPAADPPPPPAKAESAPDVAKVTRDSGHKGVAKSHSKAGASGDGAVSRGPTAHTPKSEHKTLPTDVARSQGEWAVVAHTIATKVLTKEDLARTKTVWEFDGNNVTVRNTGDSPGLVYYRGSMRFHPDLTPKTFDFNGKNRKDQAVEMLGIYAFEGPNLVLRFRIHIKGDGPKPARPDSLKIEPDPKAGYLVRLRRAKA